MPSGKRCKTVAQNLRPLLRMLRLPSLLIASPSTAVLVCSHTAPYRTYPPHHDHMKLHCITLAFVMSNTSNGTRLEDVWLTGIGPLYIEFCQQGLLAHHAALHISEGSCSNQPLCNCGMF